MSHKHESNETKKPSDKAEKNKGSEHKTKENDKPCPTGIIYVVEDCKKFKTQCDDKKKKYDCLMLDRPSKYGQKLCKRKKKKKPCCKCNCPDKPDLSKLTEEQVCEAALVFFFQVLSVAGSYRRKRDAEKEQKQPLKPEDKRVLAVEDKKSDMESKKGLHIRDLMQAEAGKPSSHEMKPDLNKLVQGIDSNRTGTSNSPPIESTKPELSKHSENVSKNVTLAKMESERESAVGNESIKTGVSQSPKEKVTDIIHPLESHEVSIEDKMKRKEDSTEVNTVVSRTPTKTDDGKSADKAKHKEDSTDVNTIISRTAAETEGKKSGDTSTTVDPSKHSPGDESPTGKVHTP